MTEPPVTPPPPDPPPDPPRRRADRRPYGPTLDTWLLVACVVMLVLIILGVGVVDADTW